MPKTNISILTVALILLILFFQNPLLKAFEEETSFVLLIVRTETRELIRDDFFEIFDRSDYILLPVAYISQYLELQTRFFREDNILLVEHLPSDRSSKVDFKNGTYEGYPDLSEQPPVQYEGDFFVSATFLEKLADVRISWQPRRQEVIITIDFDEDDPISEEELEDPFDQLRVITLVPDTFGPENSLGSIQYKVSGLANITQDGNWNFSSQQRFNIHGRVQNWAVSLGLSSTYNFTRSELSLSIPLLRATLQEENLRVVLGDSRINYPASLGNKSLRGINFQTPGFFSPKTRSLTTISGFGEKGSKVTLFLNGKLIGEQTIGDEEMYYFRNVFLEIRLANKVLIVIETPDGTKEIREKKIVGHPGVFRENTNELGLAAGLHGRVGDYDGNMLGALYYYAISNDLSLNFEALRLQRLRNEEYQLPEVGLATGLSGRPWSSAVLGFDLLMGGFAYDLDFGFRTYLLQGFTRGYLEGTYFHVPLKTSRTLREIPGQRLLVTGGYNLTPKWSLRMQGDIRRSFPDMVFFNQDRGTLTLLYRNTSLGNFSFSLIGGKREFDFEVYENVFVRVEARDAGIRIQHSLRRAIYDWQLSLGYLAGQLHLPDGSSRREDNYNMEIELSTTLTNSVFLTGNMDLEMKFIDQELLGGTLNLEGSSNYSLNPNSFLSARIKSDLFFEETGLTDLERGETSGGIEFLHFFDYDTILRLGGYYNWYPYLNASFFSGDGSLSYLWADRRGRINLNLGFKTPMPGREAYQFTAGSRISWEFESGLTAEFSASRLYQTIFDVDPIYSFELGFSQVLGFGSGRIIGQTHTGSNQHNNFIAGLVFLDLNGNGIYDPGEPLLENIPLVSGGISRSTDKNGRFLFENLLPGIYEVKFDETTLPADYSIVTSPKVVELRENENFFLEFGVTANGIISGRVFLDRNLSGTYDAGDEPMSFVGIYIETLERVIYTRRDGTFYLENVPLGEHKLRVLDETLPAFTSAGELSEFSITLSPEQLVVENLLIPVRY